MALRNMIPTMSASYKTFPSSTSASRAPTQSTDLRVTPYQAASPTSSTVLSVMICFFFIIAAIWSTSHILQGLWILATVIGIVTYTFRSRRTRPQLGLLLPGATAALQTTIFGVVSLSLIFAAAIFLGQGIPATPNWPTYYGMLQYLPWAFLQEFILQSFFFLSFESIVGGKRAVWLSALLFAAAHIPNPILTIATFLGALFFCEMFRRSRSLLPLGVLHAALGLALALSVPNSLIHHMRVGIGYIHFM
jgi:membrane protease YdiL (CAAX protease family)